jgi:RNA recognition motif-containing protein
MNSYSSGRRSRRSRGGSRRRGGPERFWGQQGESKAQKKTFWQRVAALFGNGKSTRRTATAARNGAQPSRPPRKPERVEVTSPRLYVGNLSFDATESDLFELFNGVGHVQNAEVVSYRHNQRSKGFAFVQMQTIEEAKRAVQELHDKEFLGRRLVVSGAKSGEHQSRG